MYYFSIPFSFPPFISPGGQNLVKLHLMKLKMTTSGPVPDNKLNLSNATHRGSPVGGTPATRPRMTAT